MSQTPNKSDGEVQVNLDPNQTTPNGTGNPQEPSGQQTPQTKDGIDYEEKFKQSSSEAQRLLKENEELKKSLEEKNKQTQENLRSFQTQQSAQPAAQGEAPKASPLSEKELAVLAKAYDREVFNDEWSKVIARYPHLKGKKAEFKAYAYKDENLSTPTIALAAQFMIDNNLVSQTKEEEEEETKKGSPALEQTTGGGSKIPPKKLTTEEIARMRTNDPKRYADELRKGNIQKALS